MEIFNRATKIAAHALRHNTSIWKNTKKPEMQAARDPFLAVTFRVSYDDSGIGYTRGIYLRNSTEFSFKHGRATKKPEIRTARDPSLAV